MKSLKSEQSNPKLSYGEAAQYISTTPRYSNLFDIAIQLLLKKLFLMLVYW
jgi:hypothetical protein